MTSPAWTHGPSWHSSFLPYKGSAPTHLSSTQVQGPEIGNFLFQEFCSVPTVEVLSAGFLSHPLPALPPGGYELPSSFYPLIWDLVS